jgi:hypothetical protein
MVMGRNGRRLLAISLVNRDLMRYMIYLYLYQRFEVNGDNVLYGDLEHVVVIKNRTPVILRTSEFKRSSK